jgi:hypothetical protein
MLSYAVISRPWCLPYSADHPLYAVLRPVLEALKIMHKNYYFKNIVD